MEKLMQYIWQHRLFDHTKLVTTDGRKLRIIDNGQLNTDSGPDFFNAKISLDGCVWAGNVEMHRRASDWRRHNHHLDPAYDSVVLHVVEVADTPVYRTNGEEIPTDCLVRLDFFSRYRAVTIEVAAAARLVGIV